MNFTPLKIILVFALSPFFCGGVLFALVLGLQIKNHDCTLMFLQDYLISALSLSFLGLIIFFIPAIFIGIIYIFTNHLKSNVQNILCCLSGFIICFLFVTLNLIGFQLAILEKGYLKFNVSLSFIGGFISFLISFFLNFIKNHKISPITLFIRIILCIWLVSFVLIYIVQNCHI